VNTPGWTTISHAERQVILLGASTAARRQRATPEQVGRLTAAIDWSRLAEALRQRKLLPVLGPRILELARGRASEDFANAVDEAIGAGRRHGAFLQLVAMRMIAALADAGIPAAPLKGPLMGEILYGDPGRRLSSDVDLLVAPEHLIKGVEVVRGLGYRAPVDYVDSDGLPLLHFALVHEKGELPPVELHWRIHWYERAFARERLLPPAGADPTEWRPEPTDELAALLLFYARDGFVDLRLACDLSAWWDVFGAGVRPGALDELLVVYPALARAVRVALKVAERIVGLPATRISGDIRRAGVRERIAVRLANPNPHTSAAQLYADTGLIDGLLMPRGDFGSFIKREVLLPREVLEEFDRRSPKRRARSSVGRGAGLLGRYVLTMTRLAHRPETLR
jgi:hypothetical protein